MRGQGRQRVPQALAWVEVTRNGRADGRSIRRRIQWNRRLLWKHLGPDTRGRICRNWCGCLELSGHGFESGAVFAGSAAFLAYGYNQIVGYGADWGPGGPAQQKERLTPPYAGVNNIGTQGGAVDPNGWFNEGGIISGEPTIYLVSMPLPACTTRFRLRQI